ncbi:MAG: MarR family winged helix-turn-helix transcriptional regulator [Paracoccaceae bacterium]
MADHDHWQKFFLVETAEGAQTLSFSRTPTVLLTFAANLFTRQSAAALTKQFDIGAMDWRMLVMLTRHPGASVALSAETIGIDKAAVSRSLSRLLDKKLVTCIAQDRDPRRKQWKLTKKGRDLHDDILVVVLSRLRKQLDGFTEADILDLSRLLEKLHKNLQA